MESRMNQELRHIMNGDATDASRFEGGVRLQQLFSEAWWRCFAFPETGCSGSGQKINFASQVSISTTDTVLPRTRGRLPRGEEK